MSRVYESLRRVEMEHRQRGTVGCEPAHAAELLDSVVAGPFELEGAPSATMEIHPGSLLVALSDPKCLAAEKFRILVTRLENLRNQRELKSLLVTSSVINEGKTLVAGNLGVTVAKHSGARVLLVEGDLHRPTLASLLGLTRLRGLTHWWSEPDESITRYVHKLNDMPLWFLSSGEACDQPSQILQSGRFAEAFAKLGNSFDWVVVDSAPMMPTVDVNLWSRLVDGMLIVVREGVAPIAALQKGLASIDSPKLIGIVLNETSEGSQTKYQSQYYSPQRDGY